MPCLEHLNSAWVLEERAVSLFAAILLVRKLHLWFCLITFFILLFVSCLILSSIKHKSIFCEAEMNAIYRMKRGLKIGKIASTTIISNAWKLSTCVVAVYCSIYDHLVRPGRSSYPILVCLLSHHAWRPPPFMLISFTVHTISSSARHSGSCHRGD